ncbi:MAG: YbhB/YbcL family Raf kinase inhibitor-like protein [Methanomassiliicoccales archaeon]|nr:YbhB/YbcL family Raf kinase inhibitor-like protein [Methanomassiliicoccales archaeon]
MKEIKVGLGFERFPVKNTGEGKNLSPPMTWEGAEGKSMAMIVDDPDAPSGTWVHWVIWNMPLLVNVPEGVPKGGEIIIPFRAMQGINSGRGLGYDGPFPPKGHGTHHYHFKVYILDGPLALQPGATKTALEEAMEGHILMRGEAVATYSR